MTQIKSILRRALLAQRWDDQGGYVMYNGNGKWSGSSHGLSFTSEELNALFAFAGIVPDKIVSLGSCEDCAHAVDDKGVFTGREQGYRGPCSPCKRPRMSNFVPVTAAKRKAGKAAR